MNIHFFKLRRVCCAPVRNSATYQIAQKDVFTDTRHEKLLTGLTNDNLLKKLPKSKQVATIAPTKVGGKA